MTIDFHELVQADKGLINKKIFTDEEIYQMELERVFARSWLYIGHESQIPNPGDYITAYMAEDPVIVWRNVKGEVNAFLNLCRHRGAKLCGAEKGNSKSVFCPYHGWTYSCDGKLVGLPLYKEGYNEELKKDEWGLIPVNRVATYKGLIFGTFSNEIPPLEEYMGDMKWYLDLMVDRTDGGLEALPGVHKWVMKTNWKIGAENFAGDSYHLHISHGSIFKLGVIPEPLKPSQGFTATAGNGYVNLVTLNLPNGRRELANMVPREVMPYMFHLHDNWDQVERRLGPERSKLMDGLLVHVGLLFPNFSYVDFMQYLFFRVWMPRGPHEIEVWSWCMVEKNMDPAVKDMVRRHYTSSFGPGGTFEQDDTEVWGQCSETARGWVSQKYPLNYQMRLGKNEQVNYPGQEFGAVIDELNQRNFFQHWAEVMNKSEDK